MILKSKYTRETWNKCFLHNIYLMQLHKVLTFAEKLKVKTNSNIYQICLS